MPTPMRYPWGKGTPKWTYDATANDSDKSFVVPTGKIWEIKSIYIEINTTATVGNRICNYTISNGTNVIYVSQARITVAASTWSGLLHYNSAPASAVQPAVNLALTQNLTNPATTSMPVTYLPAGYIIRCRDYAAVDAAADDMTVVIEYIEYDA